MITINPHGSIPGVEDYMIEYSGYTPSITVNTKFRVTTEIKHITQCTIHLIKEPSVEVTATFEEGQIPFTIGTGNNSEKYIEFIVPYGHIAYYRIVGTKALQAPSTFELSNEGSGEGSATPDYSNCHRHIGIGSSKLNPLECLKVSPSEAGKILVVNSQGGFVLVDIGVGNLGPFGIYTIEGIQPDIDNGPENPVEVYNSQIGDLDIVITESENATHYKYSVCRYDNGKVTRLYTSDLLEAPRPFGDGPLTNLNWHAFVSDNWMVYVSVQSYSEVTGLYRTATFNPIYIKFKSIE